MTESLEIGRIEAKNLRTQLQQKQPMKDTQGKTLHFFNTLSIMDIYYPQL